MLDLQAGTSGDQEQEAAEKKEGNIDATIIGKDNSSTSWCRADQRCDR
jgi:hypothetical protein